MAESFLSEGASVAVNDVDTAMVAKKNSGKTVARLHGRHHELWRVGECSCGRLGQMGAADVLINGDSLMFLKNSIPLGATWSVCAVDLSIHTVAPVAIAAGDHVQEGLEDCMGISRGVLADSSAQMVAKMKHISQLLGRDVATPAEARGILSPSRYRKGISFMKRGGEQ